MTATAATLKARWTEFAPTDNAVVSAALAEATREVDAAIYGASFDDAVTLLACHKLSLSPHGAPARLEGSAANPDSLTRTTYGAEFLSLARKRAGGFFVIGAT